MRDVNMESNELFLIKTIQGYKYFLKLSPSYEYEWDNWYKFEGASNIIPSDSKRILHPIE